MKKFVFLTLLFFPLLSNAQDTTHTSRGYNIEHHGLYLRVDTILHITQAVSFLRGAHSFSIKSAGKYMYRNIELRYREPITIWDTHAEVLVERKSYTFSYIY
ncbi:hypothetical protein [Cytophaga hutchinsonii]|uniref:Uncharacterized protein n=1 Tax=Cytophaga hutchinsonii (strain ATCC 33406 / DSM 1761 / CIP 103989 / NBRC 15051 / NCIMB 9469 / D465) TaxID=269798 RepID=A0A6N4SWQ0_CYTH3|nr:hypothetical protein [Cytophaga hutchinsonii]ABG60980.1 hypothetical protein CHU_3747 [Cytophaga hutchinsonii ATCC 33406]SFX43696.1 hypothetical protein SAMN04487930_10496 [Cytophaga hutchinsonii ATCC 33406]